MTETNPNYVPVDWADEASDRNREAVLAEAAEHDRRLVLGDTTVGDVREQLNAAVVIEEEVDYCPRCGGQDDKHEETCPMRETEQQLNVSASGCSCPNFAGFCTAHQGETATLNSAGDPIKVGDRVHHIADVNQSRRSVGVVTYVGPVEIQGSSVDNGARCRWDGGEKEESHHVDQLTVLL